MKPKRCTTSKLASSTVAALLISSSAAFTTSEQTMQRIELALGLTSFFSGEVNTFILEMGATSFCSSGLGATTFCDEEHKWIWVHTWKEKFWDVPFSKTQQFASNSRGVFSRKDALGNGREILIHERIALGSEEAGKESTHSAWSERMRRGKENPNEKQQNCSKIAQSRKWSRSTRACPRHIQQSTYLASEKIHKQNGDLRADGASDCVGSLGRSNSRNELLQRSLLHHHLGNGQNELLERLCQSQDNLSLLGNRSSDGAVPEDVFFFPFDENLQLFLAAKTYTAWNDVEFPLGHKPTSEQTTEAGYFWKIFWAISGAYSSVFSFVHHETGNIHFQNLLTNKRIALRAQKGRKNRTNGAFFLKKKKRISEKKTENGNWRNCSRRIRSRQSWRWNPIAPRRSQQWHCRTMKNWKTK